LALAAANFIRISITQYQTQNHKYLCVLKRQQFLHQSFSI